MNADEMAEVLKRTRDDGRISRAEKKALRAMAEDLDPDDRAALRRMAFDLAREAALDECSGRLLDWLEDVTRVVRGRARARSTCDVTFSPGEDCLRRIQALISGAQSTIDVCVYTITDDRISSRLDESHRRGVAVRVITDDMKTGDPGSDVDRFRTLGIPIRLDDSSHQMHHKFAVFDGRIALTGSYNWTRSAAEHNQENLVVSDDPRLVAALAAEFERLWGKFA